MGREELEVEAIYCGGEKGWLWINSNEKRWRSLWLKRSVERGGHRSKWW